MTNGKREILSEPENSTKENLKSLNGQLKIRKSLNRYVPCSEDGGIDDLAYNRIFLGILVGSKQKKRNLTPNYFIIVKNESDNTGHAYYEAINKSGAIDIIKKKLGREMIIIHGKKMPLELDIPDEVNG
jgi:hypothetical protein